MIVAAEYSFKDGRRFIRRKYPNLLREIRNIVQLVQAASHRTKVSREKTMPGKRLYNPAALNKTFKREFRQRAWRTIRTSCDYSKKHYVARYSPTSTSKGAFREMDFVKEKLGVEVQFGKYAFMVYNVCAKMTIFRNLEFIDAGIEIVPMKQFADQMSTGVSYFEQIVWDLETRGVADIDVPVLILGIDK